MSFLKSVSARLGHLLALHGGWGLFWISFLDSSFLSFPAVNDLLLIHLAGRRPSLALVYALASTAGSVLGAYTIYVIAQQGSRFLWRKPPSERRKRIERWMARNDFVAVLVAALLPPPAPFKVFAATAGALRMNPAHFGAALLVGRTLRFTAESLLGARYGTRAETYLKQHFGWASLVMAALVLGSTLLYRRFRNRAKADPGGAADVGPPDRP